MTVLLAVLLTATVVAAYAVQRDVDIARIESLCQDLYLARCDARVLAIHLRAAEKSGTRVDGSARGALDRAIAWCPASQDGRHSMDEQCTLCGLGGLHANCDASDPHAGVLEKRTRELREKQGARRDSIPAAPTAEPGA